MNLGSNSDAGKEQTDVQGGRHKEINGNASITEVMNEGRDWERKWRIRRQERNCGESRLIGARGGDELAELKGKINVSPRSGTTVKRRKQRG